MIPLQDELFNFSQKGTSSIFSGDLIDFNFYVRDLSTIENPELAEKVAQDCIDITGNVKGLIASNAYSMILNYHLHRYSETA